MAMITIEPNLSTQGFQFVWGLVLRKCSMEWATSAMIYIEMLSSHALWMLTHSAARVWAIEATCEQGYCFSCFFQYPIMIGSLNNCSHLTVIQLFVDRFKICGSRVWFHILWTAYGSKNNYCFTSVQLTGLLWHSEVDVINYVNYLGLI